MKFLYVGSADGTSVALGTIGWKMYLIWMSFGAWKYSMFNQTTILTGITDVVESLLWYFFAIETAGRTLEDELLIISLFNLKRLNTYVRHSCSSTTR
jgi:hypothetical protein